MNQTASGAGTGVVYDPVYKEHRTPAGHPETPERCDAAMRGIAEAAPADAIRRLAPRCATEDEVALCHTREYIAAVRRDVEAGFESLSTGDTEVSSRSYQVALLAAGGVLTAIDAVMDGTVRNAMCVVRPPGHHATPTRGMGFCIFNNVAIGARYAQRRHGVERVLIVDWDIHHGNGTQDIFCEDPSVFYFSIHQWPFYPGSGRAGETGRGPGNGFTLNCPFASGSGRHEVVGAFREKLVPAMRGFRPQFVLISAGFDSREDDLLGQFVLTDEDFSELTRIVGGIAWDSAEGRIVSALEGGYALRGLSSAVGAHVKCLTELACGPRPGAAPPAA